MLHLANVPPWEIHPSYWKNILGGIEQRINRLDSTQSRRYTTKVISKRGGTTVSENDQNTNTKTSRRSSLTRLLHTQSVAQAAVLIAVISLLSKFVGFVREVVIARQFGATGQTDAFLVGMMVPDRKSVV